MLFFLSNVTESGVSITTVRGNKKPDLKVRDDPFFNSRESREKHDKP